MLGRVVQSVMREDGLLKSRHLCAPGRNVSSFTRLSAEMFMCPCWLTRRVNEKDGSDRNSELIQNTQEERPRGSGILDQPGKRHPLPLSSRPAWRETPTP